MAGLKSLADTSDAGGFMMELSKFLFEKAQSFDKSLPSSSTSTINGDTEKEGLLA